MSADFGGHRPPLQHRWPPAKTLIRLGFGSTKMSRRRRWKYVARAIIFGIQSNHNIMKIILNLLLIVLLATSNGCLTSATVHRAEGYTSQHIQLSKGDTVVKMDPAGTYWIKPAPKGEDVSKMSVPDIWPESKGWKYRLYKPNAAYYVLVPVTVPIDIVSLPFLGLGFGLIWLGQATGVTGDINPH
jgi:hypothetical protein